MRFTILTTAMLAAALSAAPSMADAYLEKSSPYSVAETMQRLEKAIKDGGASVVAKVDHGGIANGAGMELRPTQLIIFGNPKMGTPMMQQAQPMALALPLRVAVYEDADGKTVLIYQDLEQVADDYGLPDGSEQVEAASRALEALTDKAVRQQ